MTALHPADGQPEETPPGADDETGIEPATGFTTEAFIFLGFTAFYLVIAVIYAATSGGEWAGVALLGFAAAYTAIAGLWFLRLRPVQREAEREQEDAPAGEVVEPHGELYLPATSIWPLGLGIGLALTLSGMAIGWPLLLPGGALLAYSVIGFAHQSRDRDPG